MHVRNAILNKMNFIDHFAGCNPLLAEKTLPRRGVRDGMVRTRVQSCLSVPGPLKCKHGQPDSFTILSGNPSRQDEHHRSQTVSQSVRPDSFRAARSTSTDLSVWDSCPHWLQKGTVSRPPWRARCHTRRDHCSILGTRHTRTPRARLVPTLRGRHKTILPRRHKYI